MKYDNDEPSHKWTMNKTDWRKWWHNALIFFAPVMVLYLTPIAGRLSLPDHVFTLQDFIPTSFTMGGIVLYIINTILDWFRKLTGGY